MGDHAERKYRGESQRNQRKQWRQQQQQQQEEKLRGHQEDLLEEAGGGSYYIYFAAVAVLGFILHTGAIIITRNGIASGLVSEANPIFYRLGSDYFAMFGFAVMLAYYCVLSILRLSPQMKLFLASVLTLMAGFDFLHDAITMATISIAIPFVHPASSSLLLLLLL